MGRSEEAYHLLLEKLHEFIRKFYLNKLIRGSVYFFLSALSAYLLFILAEHYFYFSSIVRTILFFVFILGFIGGLSWLIGKPYFQLRGILQGISEREASLIIGKYFSNVEDKLLNILQLKELENESASALIHAAIVKKTQEIQPIPFVQAIPFKASKRKARYLVAPLSVLLLILITAPSLLKNSTYKWIHFTKEFPPPPPYSFEVSPGNLEAIKGEDVPVRVNVSGEIIPQNVFVFIKPKGQKDFEKYGMEKKSAIEFSYDIKNVKQNISYYIGTEKVKTEIFSITPLERPQVKEFRVALDYPDYTRKPTDTLSPNTGDIYALKGTQAKWFVSVNDVTQNVRLLWNDSLAGEFSKDVNTQNLSMKKQLMTGGNYFLHLKSNRNITNKDTIRYSVELLEDKFPTINLLSPDYDFKVDEKMFLPMSYELADDYGFSGLKLFYHFVKNDETEQPYQSVAVPYENSLLLQRQEYKWDLDAVNMGPDDVIEYYMEVWDNDRVSGPKSTRTGIYRAVFPSLKEMFSDIGEKQEDVKNELSKLLEENKKLNEDLQKLQEKMLTEKELTWEDKKQFEKLVEKQQQLQKQATEAANKFQQAKEKLEENNLVSEKTLEKYKELQKIVDQIKSPELEALLKKMQELMDKLRPDEIKKSMSEMMKQQEQIDKDLERSLELFKNLLAEQKLQELMQKLEQLADKQDELSKQTDEKKSKENADSLSKNQEQLQNEFKETEKEMKELEDLKKELGHQDNFDELHQDEQNVEQQMQQSQENMQQGKMNKSSQNQKNASQKMREMSDKLNAMQNNMEMQQMMMNLGELREVLENVLSLSFSQEDLMNKTKSANFNDPSMKDLTKKQMSLKDGTKMVADSLRSLANKVFQIKSYLNKELQSIDENMNQSISSLENRQTAQAQTKQQLTMTSMNNIAVMLSEAMKEMMQQMQQQQKNQGSCNKPGMKMSLKQLGQMQQQLNDQIKEMMNGKLSDKAKQDALSRLAAQQEMIRNQLEQEKENLEQNGDKPLGDLGKIADQMKESENDMVNNQLTQELLMRQQEILTRLLDAARSMREREWENTRESTIGKDYEKKTPEELQLEKQKERIRKELLKSLEPAYSIDYQNIIKRYYEELEKINLNY